MQVEMTIDKQNLKLTDEVLLRFLLKVWCVVHIYVHGYLKQVDRDDIWQVTSGDFERRPGGDHPAIERFRVPPRTAND